VYLGRKVIFSPCLFPRFVKRQSLALVLESKTKTLSSMTSVGGIPLIVTFSCRIPTLQKTSPSLGVEKCTRDYSFLMSGIRNARQLFVYSLVATTERLGAGKDIPSPSDIVVTRWRFDPYARGAYCYIPVAAPGEEECRFRLACAAGAW